MGLAAHEHLVHAFALIVVPSALLAFLGLVGVWGTLQHQWLQLDAPDLVAFGQGLLGVGTPLVCAPLLVWGGLASGALDPPLAAFALAALLPGLTHWFALPRGRGGRGGNPSTHMGERQPCVGSAELKLLAAATAALPAIVHVAIHYQVYLSYQGKFSFRSLCLVVLFYFTGAFFAMCTRGPRTREMTKPV